MQLNIEKASEKKKSNPHLALVHESQGGSANNRHTSLLMKSDNVELTAEIIKAVEKFGVHNFPEEIQKAVTAMNKRSILENIVQEEYEAKDDWGWNCTWLCDYDDTYVYFMRKGELYQTTYTQDGVNFKIGDVAEPVVMLNDYQVVDGELEISESAKDKLEEGMYAMITKSLNDPEKNEKIKTLVTEFEKSLEKANAGSDDINVNKSKTNTEKPLDFQELMKSSEFQDLLKAQLEAAQAPLKEELEKAQAKAAEAEEILKAAEQVAKTETIEFVKSASFIPEDKAEAMVAFLMKSRKTSEYDLVMEVIKSANEAIVSMQEEVTKTKDQFALSEQGKDGKVQQFELDPKELIKSKAADLFKESK